MRSREVVRIALRIRQKQCGGSTALRIVQSSIKVVSIALRKLISFPTKSKPKLNTTKFEKKIHQS